MNPFDYSRQDIGELVLLEHVNLTIPDQRLATAFYVSGLGLTRDPYLMTGVTNMWINVGRSQIHLPHGAEQRLRGHVGLIVGSRDALLARLRAVQSILDGTRFGWTEHADHVDVSCPWGNHYRCLVAQPGDANAPWSRIGLGIAYVQLDVPTGCAAGIASFYREIFDAAVEQGERNGNREAIVSVGSHQQLVYAESDTVEQHYDGHHIQIYVANFAASYERLAKLELTYGEEPHQYRFAQIVDPSSGEPCFTLEHEVRSLRHPLFARPLVNRNPDLSNRNYVSGDEGWRGIS